MLASDIVNVFRIFVAEPYKTRWSDADVLTLASMAQRDMARETRWLEGRLGIATTIGQQEYALPDVVVGLLRVYMMTATGPQRLARTSIPQMEGDQLRMYDQSAANYTSQWSALPPAPYPVASGAFGVGYSALPMFPGTRPEFYRRGANIGVVPAPLFVYTLVIDIHALPPELRTLDDVSPLPLDWKEACAWKMCALAYFADQNTDLETVANARYAEALSKQQSWVSGLDEDVPGGPQILTHRSFYADPSGRGSDW